MREVRTVEAADMLSKGKVEEAKSLICNIFGMKMEFEELPPPPPHIRSLEATLRARKWPGNAH